MTQEMKDYIIKTLKYSKDDSLERAQRAFMGLSADQMNQQHGQSGRTRKEVLDCYQEARDKTNAAIDAVEAIQVE